MISSESERSPDLTIGFVDFAAAAEFLADPEAERALLVTEQLRFDGDLGIIQGLRGNEAGRSVEAASSDGESNYPL